MNMCDAERLTELPTLGTGQCCDRKIEHGDVSVWVCRVYEANGEGVHVSVERLRDGRWESVIEHVPAEHVDLAEYVPAYVLREFDL